jgi:hypothetical protein
MIIVQQELNVRVDIDLKTVGTKCHSPSVIPWDKITQAFEILKNVPGFTVPNLVDDGVLLEEKKMKPGDAERHES